MALNKYKKLAWFIGIWFAGVLALFVVAMLIKSVIL
ncbi:DUF2474 family protein [Psychromonas sp. 14N.309.X.WAT.B.A12]|jgi:hypothetical protein|nr:DUF2474 family protein [Psychromonas sp. 14N.309.X.WAT.B.A12]MDN2662684.1 DUF2474 family protein [Psychromonas sp. 14N.309.X.WAT.B.A12]